MQDYNKRCKDHDYRSRCFYMITLTTVPGAPILSEIRTAFGNPISDRTPLGNLVKSRFKNLKLFNPDLWCLDTIVMPDHIHFLLYVANPIERHIGEYIAQAKGECSKDWMTMRGDSEILPLFREGYHDRIVLQEGQKQVVKNYIKDNPRRYWMKKLHPDLFHRYLHLVINGREYAAFGNIHLLRDFNKVQVRAHRNWTEADYELNKTPWLKCAENGGVLVSPFIHKYEDRGRQEGMAAGARIIRIVKEGMPERFCPRGQMFELCAEGRLLIIAPWPENKRREKVFRSDCLEMNDIAAMLCQTDLKLAIKKDTWG